MRQGFKHCFVVLCSTVLVFMVGYWFYKFQIEDKDVAVVDYLALEEAENVEFPVLTICFRNPWIEERLKEYDSDINGSYLTYLRGIDLVNKNANIDYDIVTLKMSDYFMGADEKWLNDSDTTVKSTLSFR